MKSRFTERLKCYKRQRQYQEVLQDYSRGWTQLSHILAEQLKCAHA